MKTTPTSNQTARTPPRVIRRRIQTQKGLLDQKWFTYLLTCILILLVVVFVVSVKYQAWLIQQAKALVKRVRIMLGIDERPRPKPRPSVVPVGQTEPEIVFMA